jgi:hypothetical protein
MSDYQPIDYTAAELSSDEEEGLRYDVSSDSDSDAMSDVAPPPRKRTGPPRPVRHGNVVKFVQAGKIVWRAPVTIRAPAAVAVMAAAAAQPAAQSAFAAAASSSSSSSAVKRKATSPPRDASALKKQVADGSGGAAAAAAASSSSRKRPHESDSSSSKLKQSRSATGAALIQPPPPPPMGTFVNLSEGFPAMLPEVAQYPYTGPLLKKISSGAAASSSVAVDTSIKGPSPVIVPSFASWFHLEKIHEIERACLPECFVETSQTASQKSRKAYTEMRNFIIQSFRQNPRIYLSLTAVRKLLTGDATTLQRVHSFLESWGLINFHVDPGSLPTMASPGNFNSSYPLLQHSAYTGFTPLIQTRQSPDVLQHLIHHQAHRECAERRCALGDCECAES